MSKKENNYNSNEPDWLNPSADRKTPYTDKEIDTFVIDFIRGLSAEEWSEMTSKFGEEKTRERLRAGFVKMAKENLNGVNTEDLLH